MTKFRGYYHARHQEPWRSSDQEGCLACGRVWDVNDPAPPRCGPRDLTIADIEKSAARAERAAARHKRNLRRWKTALGVLLAASMVLSAHLWVLVWRLP